MGLGLSSVNETTESELFLVGETTGSGLFLGYKSTGSWLSYPLKTTGLTFFEHSKIQLPVEGEYSPIWVLREMNGKKGGGTPPYQLVPRYFVNVWPKMGTPPHNFIVGAGKYHTFYKKNMDIGHNFLDNCAFVIKNSGNCDKYWKKLRKIYAHGKFLSTPS